MMILRITMYICRVLVGLAVAAEAYLMIVRPGDDIAGGVFMGLLAIALFGTISIVTGRFERKSQEKF